MKPSLVLSIKWQLLQIVVNRIDITGLLFHQCNNLCLLSWFCYFHSAGMLCLYFSSIYKPITCTMPCQSSVSEFKACAGSVCMI